MFSVMRVWRGRARQDVAASAVAELLGLSRADFEAQRPALHKRKFPEPDSQRRTLAQFLKNAIRIKLPYYSIIAGRGYWRPTREMRALGFQIVRCGSDGPARWAIAAEWNQR